jgi:hypothetical protein
MIHPRNRLHPSQQVDILSNKPTFQMRSETRIDRRQFAASLGAGSSVVAAVLASTLELPANDVAQNKTLTHQPKPAPSPENTPTPAVPAPPSAPPLLSEESLLLNCLQQRYPSLQPRIPSEPNHDEALQGILRDLRGDLARSRMLSQIPLKNSDAPSFVFRAYRSPD